MSGFYSVIVGKEDMLYYKDIRDPLFDYLEENYGKIRVIDEKQLGKNTRADMFMVTEDTFVGFEIKSDADTYQRLDRQVKGYDLFCDKNYIVAGMRHGKHVAEHVPDYWGILLVEHNNGQVLFHKVREAQWNPCCKKEKQLSVLWREEIDHILSKNKMPKYKQKAKSYIIGRMLLKLDYELLKKQVCEELFQRDYTLV